MSPTLSVIIPVINEAQRIVPLLGMLARQEGCDFEVILCDGFSTDETIARARRLADDLPYRFTLISVPRGRGRQINQGAAIARGKWLLFLHADSEFPDPAALRKGLNMLTSSNCGEKVAGRYSLRFDTVAAGSRFGYSFCEGKARLDRPGCILGDQGFMLSRQFFDAVGRFDESLPVGEDVVLAERIRACGSFLLFPVEIRTSPRRFEREGYRSRQTLNAIIMALLFTGHTRLLENLSGCYRRHDESGRLSLEPFFRIIADLIVTLPLQKRIAFWYRIGSYVRDNAWQLAYLTDLRRDWQRGLRGGDGKREVLSWYDQYLDRLTDHPPGRFLTTGLVWIWFHLARRWSWLREGKR